MAQPANVLRSARGGIFDGDCTAGGVSATADQLMAIGPNEPMPERSALAVVRIVPHFHGTIRAVPVQPNGEPVKEWTMMGGNYLGSSDSRFSRMCDEALNLSLEKQALGSMGNLIDPPKDKPAALRFYGAVAIHDRIER